VRPVDIGVDAARTLRIAGPGRVRAVFDRALYLEVPGGLVALVTTHAPRGPLHLRVTDLPTVVPGCPVRVDADSLQIDAHRYGLDGATWTPRLPSATELERAYGPARRWLPDLCPALDVGSLRRARLPDEAVAALHRGSLRMFTASLAGRGPGLTPAGDDVLAGALLVAYARYSGSPARQRALRRCAVQAQTNDISRAFLACAARGRCIEPAHDLIDGLARRDHEAVGSAAAALLGFGSSSGAALMYGVRAALLELPDARPGSSHDEGLMRIVNDAIV
jgi:hypothetical protein